MTEYFSLYDIQNNLETASGILRDSIVTTSGDLVSYVDTNLAPVDHDHVESDITNLDKYTQSEVDALVASASGTTDHGALNGRGDDDHLQYHTDARGDIRYYQKSYINTLSGNLQSDIDSKADSVHIHTEGDITDLDKYTQSEVDYIVVTTSGDILDYVDDTYAYSLHYHTEAQITNLDKYSQSEVDSKITTTSGDIVDQIPSLTGYATESWVNTNFIDETELTTTSGDLQSNIDGKSDIGHGHIEADIGDLDKYTQAEIDGIIVTTSGDIVAQIPSVTGYATETWVSDNYIDSNEMTTISGDLVAQMGTGSVTEEQLTTTSGDIIDYVDTEISNIDALPSGDEGYLLVHDGSDWQATSSGNFTAQSGTVHEIVYGERIFDSENTIIGSDHACFGGGMAYRGKAVVGDYAITHLDHIIGVMSPSGDTVITLPDASAVQCNHFWQIVKISADSNRITVSGSVPGQFMGYYDQVVLRNRGDSVWVKTYAAADMFFFEYPQMFESFAEPSVVTSRPVLKDDELLMFGAVTEMADNPMLHVYFNYRALGESDWVESTVSRKLETGLFSTTVSGVTASGIYQVSAIAETLDGTTYSGTVKQTPLTYYGCVEDAETDGMARYWAFQESTGADAIEEIVADDAIFYGNLEISSDTVNGQTVYHRVFKDTDYGQAPYALPSSSSDFTVMIQIRSDLMSGDHTFLNFGADVCGLASDADGIQINTQGSVDTWTSATPFNEIKTLFMVCDRTSGWVRLYDLSSGSAVQRISRTTLPDSDGAYVRFGRGASGDGHHQDTEYLGTSATPGYIRSVGIWERALSTTEMEDITSFVDTEGGTIVVAATAPAYTTAGEINTASNLSTEGNIGVFTQKIGVDLQFKSLDGDYFYNDNNVVRLRDRGNIISVATSGTAYSSIQDAIDSIDDATEENRYAIEVFPGIYNEDVYMKDWIDLVGESIGSTWVYGDLHFLSSKGTTTSGESNIRDISFKSTKTTPGHKLVTVEQGTHNMAFVGLYLNSYNAPGHIVTLSGGTTLIYNSRLQHYVLGSYSGPYTNGMILHEGGDLRWALSQTIGVTYCPNTDCTVFESKGDASSFVGIYNVMHDLYSLTPTCTGVITLFKFNCESESNIIKGNRAGVISVGGNETLYGFSLNSTENGYSSAVVRSNSNKLTCSTIDNAYFCKLFNNNDYFFSTFDDVDGPESVLGSINNYEMVSSEADGELRVTRSIKMGRESESDQDLIIVDTGRELEKDNPVLQYDHDYFDYSMLTWNTSSGNIANVTHTPEGNVLVGAMGYGDDVFSYEQRLSVWAHKTSTGDPLGYERRGYRLKRKTNEDFAISRHWTYRDGGAFVDLWTLSPEGGMSLKDGTGEVSAIYDEDDFASNSASGIATQQSIKAYVDLTGVPNAVAQANSYTDGLVTTASGDIIDYVDGEFATISGGVSFIQLTTTSGDIIDYVNSYVAPSNFIPVASSGTQFTDIQSAIDNITDASEENAYAVYVYPGTYTGDILLKDWVDIVGVSNGQCIIDGTVTWPADQCTSSGWSSLHNLEISQYECSTSGMELVRCFAGDHDIHNCYLYLEMDSVAGTILTISGGHVHSYLTELEYYADGNIEGETHRSIKVDSGRLTDHAGEVYMSLDSDCTGDLIMVELNSPVYNESWFVLASNLAATVSNPSYTDTAIGIRVRGESDRNTFQASRIQVGAVPCSGVAYAYYIDSSDNPSESSKIHSSQNKIQVTGFDKNYSYHLGTSDELVSHFDYINAVDGVVGTGASGVLMASCDSDGNFVATGKITVGLPSNDSRDMLVVEQGLGYNNPKLSFEGDYFGYAQMSWAVASGSNTFTATSPEGPVLMGSMSQGPNAFDYEQRLSMWGHKTNDGSPLGYERRGYRMKRKTTEEFAISRHWTYEDGGDFVDLLTIDPWGALSLRYGDASVSAIYDEDNMVSNSASGICTQQSIKAYVDYMVSTVSGGSGPTGSGYVTGPTTSTVNTIPVWDDINGDVLTDTGVGINSDVITAAGIETTDDIKAATLFQVDVGNNQINFGDIDGTVKTFITNDGKVSVGGGNLTGNNLLQVDSSATQTKSTAFTSSVMEVDSEDGLKSDFLFRLSVDGGWPAIALAKSRGNLQTPTSVQNGDNIGGLYWVAYDGNSWEYPAYILATVDGTPGDGDLPTKVGIYTSADGTISPQERLVVKEDGAVGIGNSSPSERLDTGTGNTKTNFVMAEKLDLTERSSAPSSLADGDMWHQDDDDFRARTNGRTMVQGMVNMVQCQHDSGSRVDCNTASWLPLTWTSEDVKDDLYTHDNVTNNTRITVATTGWYRITYSVSHESSGSRRTVHAAIRKNGSTLLTPGHGYSYNRNGTDEFETSSATSVHRLTANDYIEIVARGEGTTGTSLSMQDGSTYVLVEFVRFSN